jgi:hypothetical protein
MPLLQPLFPRGDQAEMAYQRSNLGSQAALEASQ